MSVTIADLLRLPCMRGAQVVGGQSGLNRQVEYVTVLEFSLPGPMEESLYAKLSPIENEIIITAMADAWQDVELQCEILRYQKKYGDVGMLLYYVGVIVPRIDPKLAATADELGFPLICMPVGDYSLRYSDAIREIMELIIRDRNRGEYFLPEVLRRITQRPEQQRSVASFLRLLADCTGTGLVLADGRWNPLDCALWPGGEKEAGAIAAAVGRDVSAPWLETTDGTRKLALCAVQRRSGADLNLIVLREDRAPEYSLLNQLQEAVQLFIGLQGEHYAQSDPAGLLSALIRGESLAVRHIAARLGLELAELCSMAVVSPRGEIGPERMRHCLTRVREELGRRYPGTLTELYGGSVVLLGDAAFGRRARVECQALEEQLRGEGMETRMFLCSHLTGPDSFAPACRLFEEAQENAEIIFPEGRVFTYAQLETARRCGELYRENGEEYRKTMEILQPLQTVEEPLRRELYLTLSVFLLDAGQSMAETAKRMYLHKNTIKYRMKKINDCLGFSVAEMPESAACYLAAALGRLAAD